jgi:small subunit ribosomal protein S2
MASYIYGVKNGVHVIDLRQTLTRLKEAYEYVKASSEEGRIPLFVGTKTQVQRIVKEEADRCGSPYINFRWLGGLLTNFGTVKQSIARMKSFEEIAGEDGSYEGVLKKEALLMERKRLKLERSLGGVRNMKSIPSMLFITDCHREQLALKEAQKLGIPVVGISDTGCDPTGIDFMIPGNDDSPRAVALYANVISTAVIEGLALRKQKRIESSPPEKAQVKKSKPVIKKSDVKEDLKLDKDTVSESLKAEKSSPIARAKDSKKTKKSNETKNSEKIKIENESKASEKLKKIPIAKPKSNIEKTKTPVLKDTEEKKPAKKAKSVTKTMENEKKVDASIKEKNKEKKTNLEKITKKSTSDK